MRADVVWAAFVVGPALTAGLGAAMILVGSGFVRVIPAEAIKDS